MTNPISQSNSYLGPVAFVATTTTAGVGACSIYAASKSETTGGVVLFGSIGLVSSCASAAFAMTWMGSAKTTTCKEYFTKSGENTGVIVAGVSSAASQALAKAAIDGVAAGVRRNVYDFITKKPEEDDKGKGRKV